MGGLGPDELSFSGRTWEIEKSTTTIIGPGDNYFYYNALSDSVDANGYLHMSALNVNGKRYASEINLTGSLGYGTYSLTIQGDVSKLDKNVVLGFFTWDGSDNSNPGNTYNREIDMEMSRWTCATCTNDEVGVQPEPPEAVRDFWMNYTGDIVESMHWKAGEVDFLVKEAASPYTTLYQWNYTGSLVPTPGYETMTLNVWQDEAPTTNNVTIVMKSFSFTPG